MSEDTKVETQSNNTKLEPILYEVSHFTCYNARWNYSLNYKTVLIESFVGWVFHTSFSLSHKPKIESMSVFLTFVIVFWEVDQIIMVIIPRTERQSSIGIKWGINLNTNAARSLHQVLCILKPAILVFLKYSHFMCYNATSYYNLYRKGYYCWVEFFSAIRASFFIFHTGAK